MQPEMRPGRSRKKRNGTRSPREGLDGPKSDTVSQRERQERNARSGRAERRCSSAERRGWQHYSYVKGTERRARQHQRRRVRIQWNAIILLWHEQETVFLHNRAKADIRVGRRSTQLLGRRKPTQNEGEANQLADKTEKVELPPGAARLFMKHTRW